MALVTIQNHRDAQHPVEQKSYVFAEGMVPRAGEHIHLHDQGRLAEVVTVVYMAQGPHPGTTMANAYCQSVILVVAGHEPNPDFDGLYS